MNKQILIFDLGSQYTLVIARVITALGVQCRVIKPKDFKNLDGVRGVILSGSNYSVSDENAPKIPEEIFESNVPILGICYGMQYMAYREEKNSVWSQPGKKEYGPVGIKLNESHSSQLFTGLANAVMVFASHGDTVHTVPENYVGIAHSMTAGLQAMEHKKMPWYAVQFHPEVDDTRDDNIILKNFIFGICKCKADWNVEETVEEIVQNILDSIYEGKAVLGVSGGVDSTTLAAMLSPILGDKLHCVLIDHGAMRKNEVEQVLESCRKHKINLHVISAKDQFIDAMSVTTDSEEKRAIFKEVYQTIFIDEIKKISATHIIQGTLATDLIESGSAGESTKIKSHHNVGLDFEVTELMPFAHLFKHEVRDIARNIGLSFSERQPFPGPGLFLRIVGIGVTNENLSIAREADYLVTEILKDEDWYDKISQLVVALIGINTVGVQGDERSYKHPVVIRAVQTSDFMTASAIMFPEHVKQSITTILTSHGLTNRVWWDETPKPPATTEME